MASFNQSKHDTRFQESIQNTRDLNVQTVDGLSVTINQANPPPAWVKGSDLGPLKAVRNSNSNIFDVTGGTPNKILINTGQQPGGYLISIQIRFIIDQTAIPLPDDESKFDGVQLTEAKFEIGEGAVPTFVASAGDWVTTRADGNIPGGEHVIRLDKIFYLRSTDSVVLTVTKVGWTGPSNKIVILADIDVQKL
jgi:hypothetical protein